MHLQSVLYEILFHPLEEQVSASYTCIYLYFSSVLQIPQAVNFLIFLHCDCSGIMALCATSSYYDITEVATRILPNVVVLTIDPDRLHPANGLLFSYIPVEIVWF